MPIFLFVYLFVYKKNALKRFPFDLIVRWTKTQGLEKDFFDHYFVQFMTINCYLQERVYAICKASDCKCLDKFKDEQTFPFSQAETKTTTFRFF